MQTFLIDAPLLLSPPCQDIYTQKNIALYQVDIISTLLCSSMPSSWQLI